MTSAVTPIDRYSIYLVEKYKVHANLPGREVLKLFETHKVFDYIEYAYAFLHTQSEAFVLEDIDSLIAQSVAS